MKSLPHIVRIITIDAFEITTLWNSREIRALDFVQLFKIWETAGDARYNVLRDEKIFKQVTLSKNHTLCWPNVPVQFTQKGKTQIAPLELNASELYRQSTLVKKLEKQSIGTISGKPGKRPV